MVAKLVAEEGILKGLVLSLEEGDQWVIGRDPDACQLLIEDPSASRKHLICRNTPQGIVLENLSDTNPVQVNDEEVKEPRLLQNGDAVKIGSGTFRFYAEAAAQLFKETPSEVANNEKNGTSSPAASSHVNGTFDALDTAKETSRVHTVKEESTEEEMEPHQDTIFEEEAPLERESLAEIDFGLVDTGRWLLKVIGGPNNGAEFSMQTGASYIIGTDPNSCDIVFHDTSVSRQHARISVSPEDVLTIEDLKSRNGTLVDGEPLKSNRPLDTNTLVSLGTTSFIVFDREGEMQTIISPLLPSIVKVLQKEEPKKAEEPLASTEQLAQTAQPALTPIEKSNTAIGAFILIGIITGLFVIAAIGTSTLFKSEPVVAKEIIEPIKVLDQALAPFPTVKYSYNKNSGRLLLVGHVLSGADKNELMYSLQGLKFIKSLDDAGIVIDEGVWREINQVLEKNHNWKGITVHSTSAGHFVLTGSLQTRAQAERLYDYISINFPYVDLLEKRIFVEEDVINSVNTSLQSMGLKDVQVKLNNGEISLSGTIPPDKIADFDSLLVEFKTIPGIRSIKNLVTGLAPEQSVINISDKYEVTGISNQGGNLSVVINGRILAHGDSLDGLTITSIKGNAIFLEKDGTKYRIDFSK